MNNNNKKPKQMFNLFEKEQLLGNKIIHKWIICIVVYLQYLDGENADRKRERGVICIKSPQLEEKKKSETLDLCGTGCNHLATRAITKIIGCI